MSTVILSILRTVVGGLGLMVPFFFFIDTLKVQGPEIKLEEAVERTQVMMGVSLKISQNEKLDWSMVSDEAEAYTGDVWKLKGVKVAFLGAGNKVNLTSKRGSIEIESKDMSLSGGVKAVSQNGYTFYSEDLTYDDETKKINTSSRVKIKNKQKNLLVKSKGMRGDLETGELDLLSEVECKQSLLGYDDILIKSKKAKVKSKLKNIRFTEDLRVTQKKFSIKGREAFFAYDNQEKGELKSIQVLGNIRATDGEKTALSEKVEMKVKEDVILFQGSPRLIVGDNEMVGEEILVTNRQQNVQVIKGNIKSTKEVFNGKEK